MTSSETKFFFLDIFPYKGKNQTTNAQILMIYLSIILICNILCAVN